jgi:hypothetical protein
VQLYYPFLAGFPSLPTSFNSVFFGLYTSTHLVCDSFCSHRILSFHSRYLSSRYLVLVFTHHHLCPVLRLYSTLERVPYWVFGAVGPPLASCFFRNPTSSNSLSSITRWIASSEIKTSVRNHPTPLSRASLPRPPVSHLVSGRNWTSPPNVGGVSLIGILA